MIGAPNGKMLAEVGTHGAARPLTPGDQLDPKTIRADEIGKLASGEFGDGPPLLEPEAEDTPVPVNGRLHIVDTEADMICAQRWDWISHYELLSRWRR